MLVYIMTIIMYAHTLRTRLSCLHNKQGRQMATLRELANRQVEDFVDDLPEHQRQPVLVSPCRSHGICVRPQRDRMQAVSSGRNGDTNPGFCSLKPVMALTLAL